jgi:hypothetical protein
MEELTLDIDVDGMPYNWVDICDDMMWHELLLPFIGVKKLRFGSLLTFELSRALNSVTGGLVLELLPELQELELKLNAIDQAKNAISVFAETRESVGRPVQLRVPHILRANPQRARSYLREASAIYTSSLLRLSDSLKIEADNKKELEALLERIEVIRESLDLVDSSMDPTRNHHYEENFKRDTHENRRRLHENPQRRANENWRYRGLGGASRINARISQPRGKIAI